MCDYVGYWQFRKLCSLGPSIDYESRRVEDTSSTAECSSMLYDPRFADDAGYFASFIKTVVVVVVATWSENNHHVVVV